MSLMQKSTIELVMYSTHGHILEIQARNITHRDRQTEKQTDRQMRIFRMLTTGFFQLKAKKCIRMYYNNGLSFNIFDHY